jgi:hypothetical protein
MLAVSFYTFMLFVHIAAVMIAFGVTFAYPLVFTVGRRMDPRAMPWFHAVQAQIDRRLIMPGLAVVLIAGIYLASKLHVWSAFYVQWGLGVAIALGALGGMFFTPRELRLSELAARDVAAAGDGEVVFSEEYEALSRQVGLVAISSSLIIVLTVLFMTAQTGG